MQTGHGHLAEQFASSSRAEGGAEFVAVQPFTIVANARPATPIWYEPHYRCWVVTRYHDVKHILRHPGIFSTPPPHAAFQDDIQALVDESGFGAANTFAAYEHQDHLRLRNAVGRAYSPQRMNAFEPHVRDMVNYLLDTIVDLGRADLFQHLVSELPVLVLCKLMGIPAHDVARVRQWESSRLLLKWGNLDADEQRAHAHNLVAYGNYLRAHVTPRMEVSHDDLPGELARMAQTDSTISQDEIVTLCITQFIAGHETLLNLLGGGLQILLSNPAQWQLLAQNPFLIPNAVEEILRAAPSQFAWRRRATQNVTMDGVQLPAGAELVFVPGAANHDASVFANADELNVRRTNAREHLAFGHGMHYCLGAPLARLTLRVLLDEMTQRLPNLRPVASETFEFVPRLPFLQLAHLWAEWERTTPRKPLTAREKYILPFEQCDKTMVARVGGKCASLGAMIQAGAPVPPGFAVTTEAYARILATNSLGECIHGWLDMLDPAKVREEESVSRTIRKLIEEMPLPPEMEQAIRNAYAELCAQASVDELPVAVRSSATAEDLPGASFAGQQDTFLWVVGADAVIEHVRKCWSSLYTARAISYRHDNGFAHEKVLMSVAVQKMVNASSAGVAMTLNPINGDRSKIVIDANWGLGETVVGGTVTPDNFLVDKVLLEVVAEKISDKHAELVADIFARCVVEREIDGERRTQPCLTRAQILAVAKIAKRAEQFYGSPQDVEWAIDADLPEPNNVIVLQSRPETVWSQKQKTPSSGSSIPQFGVASVLNTLLAPLEKKKTS
jgi:pyruvate,water dikinase